MGCGFGISWSYLLVSVTMWDYFDLKHQKSGTPTSIILFIFSDSHSKIGISHTFLTNLCLLEYSTLIKWTNPYWIGLLRIVALSISSHEQTQKTESAVFLSCRLFLYLKDPFFDHLGSN